MISTKIIPRVSETDGAGHINNTVIPIWFEAGRREIFKVLTPNLSFENWKVALVNMNVDYIDQILFNTEVVVKTLVKKIGNKSFVIYEEVHQNNHICAKGTVTYVYFNYKNQKSEIIPEEVRSKLASYMTKEK